MLSGRLDIIGDIARLRNTFVGATNDATDVLVRLELLSAAAVHHGMSYTIVGKAGGIPRARIEAVLVDRRDDVEALASEYERRPSGIVVRRQR